MRLTTLAVAAVLSIAALGCGPIRYENSIEQVDGRNVYVEPATIGNCHAALDKAGTEADITKRAKELLKGYGYTVVEDAGSANLVLRAEVMEFQLGSTTARVLVGGGQAWHDTNIVIQPKGPPPNVGNRRAEVSAGAYSNWKGTEPHRRALVEEIAKMHVWVAQKYCR